MIRFRPKGLPCSECGGTENYHLGNCSGSFKKRQRRGNEQARKKCESTYTFAGRKPHLTHTCTLTGLHHGHACSVPGCEVTW